jgi:hypothetical protein
MGAFEDPDSPCGFATYCTWSEVGGYLPTETSHVVVVPAAIGPQYLMRRTDITEFWTEASRPLPSMFGPCDEVLPSTSMERHYLARKALRVLEPSDR